MSGHDTTLPPFHPEAERAVVASILAGTPIDAAPLEAGHFFDQTCRLAFIAAAALAEDAALVSLVSVTTWLRSDGKLDQAGGPGALAELLIAGPGGVVTVEHHFPDLEEARQRRAALSYLARAGRELREGRMMASAFVSELAEQAKPIAERETAHARPLIDLRASEPDEADTLLGDRYLNREGGMLFVGSSGIGKSSASVQMDVSWSIGREAFGIRPARPLRILQIQAENDDGDLHEMVAGVSRAMALTGDEIDLCRENLLVYSEKAKTAGAFISEVVAPLLEWHKPDLLRLDPLLAYLGGDPTDMAALSAFCRNMLNPLLEKHRCGCIINHHTPKTTNRDTSAWRPSDWMYSGAGAADLTNWARAVLVIEPTSNPDAFRFIAAKRGKRIGWINQFGETCYERMFCHSEGGIAWREATEEEIAGIRPAKDRNTPDDEALIAHVPIDGAISKDALMSKWNGLGLGEKKCRGKLAELRDVGRLHEWRKRRPGVRPEILISRHEETLL